MKYVAYVETVNLGGKDATFDTAEKAWEWVRERLQEGSYHTGDVTEVDTGERVPEPKD
jgi:hypothetical protein